jgi:very-short-patch-repair endonuclease
VRQTPIGPYFADFLCRERKVIVEVDGGTHGTDAELARDDARTADLRRLGYRIFRIRNVDVYENIELLLDALLDFTEGEVR